MADKKVSYGGVIKEMTDLDKENKYGVAWIIYDSRHGIPDVNPSMYRPRPTIIWGTIADVEEYMEHKVFSDDDDPRRWISWFALKVSKEGTMVYGEYSIPLCVVKDEKKRLLTKSYQLAVMQQDKRYDCLKNYKQGYLIKVSPEQKESLQLEFDKLEEEGMKTSKKITEMGISSKEHLEYDPRLM
jgi:hypothetical protein